MIIPAESFAVRFAEKHRIRFASLLQDLKMYISATNVFLFAVH